MSFFSVTGNGGIRRLIVGFDHTRAELPKLLQKVLLQVGEETVKALHEAAPVGIGRTGGHLADSFSTVEGDLHVEVVTSQPQKLEWVRYGTGLHGPLDHYIVPRTKQFMWWPEAPHPMARVRGQHPNDFVTPVLDSVTTYVEEAVVPLVDQITLLLEGG